MFESLRYRIGALLRGRQIDRELAEELRYHIERETEKLIASGVAPDEARRRAHVLLGGVENLKESHRDARGSRWLSDAAADVRFAARGLRRNPTLVLAAIITIAIAIGANTAIYTAVEAVLLRPLPFDDPGRLAMIGEDNPEFHWHMAEAAPANFFDWRARVTSFADVMAYSDYPQTPTLMVGGEPKLVTAAFVTGNFFSVLGVPPALGRLYRDDETWDTAAPTVVISDRLWRTQLGADRAIVGKSIVLNGRPRTVIGVAPASFAFPWADVDMWLSIGWSKSSMAQVSFRRAHWIRVIARLKPGVSFERANAELRGVAAQLKREYPVTNRVMDAELEPLQRFLVGDTRLPLLVLLAAVGLLLLVACANVGNLLLVRAASREREVALRVALGASRWRLVRQALAETLLLSLVSGAIGFALGLAGTRALGAMVPAGMLSVAHFSVDWRVAWYVAGLSLACGALFSIAPLVWAVRLDPNDALKAGGRAAGLGAPLKRWGQRLVVAEVALALVMTIGAALLVRSYALLASVNPGFDATNVMTATILLPGTRYDSARKVDAFFDELVGRARATPGVLSAGAASSLPLTTPGWSSQFSIQGTSAGHYSASLLHREVAGDYFRTMRVPLLRGRFVTSEDRTPPYVTVINEAFARRYFAGVDPIGQRITFDLNPDSTSLWRTIVGVVGSERQTSLAGEPDIEVYEPLPEELTRRMTLVARVREDPTALAPAIRRIVRELDPQLAITDLRPMADVQAASLARQRFLMTLLSAFAVIGLLLAVVGVYGVVAQVVRARRREMAVRLALGARASALQWLVVRYGLSLALAGLVLGIGAAVLVTRWMAAMLYEVAPTDPLTIGGVSFALLGAAFVACWLPGRRATRVDPLVELREE